MDTDFDSFNCSNYPAKVVRVKANLYRNEIQHKPVNLLFICLNLMSASFVISK